FVGASWGCGVLAPELEPAPLEDDVCAAPAPAPPPAPQLPPAPVQPPQPSTSASDAVTSVRAVMIVLPPGECRTPFESGGRQAVKCGRTGFSGCPAGRPARGGVRGARGADLNDPARRA